MAMLLSARLCRASALQGTLFKQLPSQLVRRNFASEGRDTLGRTVRRRATIKEQAMAPAGQTGKKFDVNSVHISSLLLNFSV